MALAILELVAVESNLVRFKADIGTSHFYQLKVGRGVRRRAGIDWVDGVYGSTALQPGGGDLLAPPIELALPRNIFREDEDHAYVQLVSFKSRDGKSPAFSRIVEVPVHGSVELGPPLEYSPPLSLAMSRIVMTAAFAGPRKIPCRSAGYSRATSGSVADLLGLIANAAAPVVLDLFKGSAAPAQNASDASEPGVALATLFRTILEKVAGGAPPVSKATSLADNRFQRALARPFIFGIDDALLAGMIGPVLQVLPQLANAANQKRVQLKQADNKLIGDILSDVNRRLMLQQLADAQRQTPAAQSPDLQQLLQLLQQAAPAAAPAVPATTSSLSLNGHAQALSRTAVVSFITAPELSWRGVPKVVFAKGEPMTVNVQLNVAEPAPRQPLPKALVTLVFKTGDQTVCCRKTFRQKDLAANAVLSLTFTAEEVAALPAGEPLTAFAEVRWRSKGGREVKALGSLDLVLVNRFFLAEQGVDVSAERELVDMKRYRPFWNKIWESPSRDASGQKLLWELDVTARYAVVLSAGHPENGLMETKVLRAPGEGDSVADKTAGKMKAGIELSITALNQLAVLWDANPLDDERLAAVRTESFARDNAGEFVQALRLKGRARERGMIWVAPTFKLFELTLNAVTGTNAGGQVTAVTPEKVRFPLPVSARVIGVKSARS